MDMKMEQLESKQDIDLMPYNQEVNPPGSPDAEAEKVLRNQGDTEILEDNPEEERHNISFDESHHRFLQSHKATTLDVHTSPTQFEEWVIIYDVCKRPTSLADATRAYVEATISGFCFLIAANE